MSNYDFERRWKQLDEQNAAMNDPAAYAARRGAMLDAQLQREKQLRGDFEQNARLKKELEGTWRDRAGEQRALQGTWQDRAAQEEKIQGTFRGRESGLNLRQENQLENEMARARLMDTGATERTRMGEEGATGRTRMGQEGENWRRMYEPTHYAQEEAVDKEGNVIRRTVPYQYGQPVNQGKPSILSTVAPNGFKNADHFISTYSSLPDKDRGQFLKESTQAYPDVVVASRNLMQDQLKTGKGSATAPKAIAPSVASAPPVAIQPEQAPSRSLAGIIAQGLDTAKSYANTAPPAAPAPIAPAPAPAATGPTAMPDREARYLLGETTGGDINPINFPKRPAAVNPPDLSYVTSLRGQNTTSPEDRWTPPTTPVSTIPPAVPAVPAAPPRRFISPYLTGTEQGLPTPPPSRIQNPDLGPASTSSRMPTSYPKPLMDFPMPETQAAPSRRFVSPYLTASEQGLAPAPPPPPAIEAQQPDLGPASVPSRMPPSYPRPLMNFPMPEEPKAPLRRFMSPYLTASEQGFPSPPPERNPYVEPEVKPRKKVFRTPFMY